MSVLSLRLDTLPRGIDVEDEKVFSVLGNFLQPASATSTSEAAQAIVSLGRESQSVPLAFMECFFEITLHAARQVPHNHPSQQKLVDLIQALRSPPASNHQHPWTEFLAISSGELAETYRGPVFPSQSQFVQGKSVAPTADAVAQWLNLNSFIARLWTSVGSGTDATIEFEFYAGVALRSALEGYSDFTGTARREEDRKNDGALDCDVAVAAEWIDQAGSVIYAASHGKDGGEPAPEDKACPGTLYHGPQNFCDERWQFWKKRFGEISTEEGVSEKSKSRALEAKLAMEKIEQ